jgi:signal transduction histidine kinase
MAAGKRPDRRVKRPEYGYADMRDGTALAIRKRIKGFRIAFHAFFSCRRSTHMNTPGTPFGMLLICMAFLLPASAAAGDHAPVRTVRVGLYQNKPKIFTDAQGRPAGIFVDILREIGKRAGWDIQYIEGSWDECLDHLSRGNIDLMPDVAWSEERAAIYDFNAETILTSWSQLYARRGVEAVSLLDVQGKRVAVLGRSVQHGNLLKTLVSFDISCEVVACDSYDSAFKALETGKADLAISNRFFGIVNRGLYKARETPVVFDPASLHYAVKKGRNRAIIAAIDDAVRAMKSEVNSPYYGALGQWLGGKGTYVIPASLKWIAGGGLAIMLVSLAFACLLRWRLHVKTNTLRAALEDLGRAQAEAVRRERLHTLGQMASGIAHDFNNVLAPISGYTEMLLEDPGLFKDEAKIRKYVGIMNNAARDGAEIVKRMRMFYAGRPEERREVVAPETVVDDVEDLVRPRLSQAASSGKIAIKRLHGGRALICVDGAEIREAVLNIVNNAIDAMPEGGTIVVETDRQDGMATIAVEDTGAGMDEETKRNCLRPFYTTKGAGGTGMGLAMVAGIVEKYGGRIAVTSEKGKGCRVSLSIPEAEAGPESGPVKSASYAVAPLRILALDDDARALNSLAALLAVDGHEVDTFTDPGQALIRVAGGKYNLVIIDHVMPGLNGDMLAPAIRQVAPDSPIIMVTGQDEASAGLFAGGAHIRKVLSKPVRLNVLRETLVELGLGKPVGGPAEKPGVAP